MAWVPPGTLVAGTPADRVPRVADAELAGEAIELGGFFIDVFNYPGEVAGIASSGVSFVEAQAICERQGKRLCSELEWERACKGPNNHVYEYGDRYDHAICGTGTVGGVPPSGANARCVSGFGVHDLHGGVWNWTASLWGRGASGKPRVVRGGDGADGELVGRCANGRPQRQGQSVADIGVRCCAGRPNHAEVTLSVVRGPVLAFERPTAETARALAALVPVEALRKTTKGRSHASFTIERTWWWRPVANERLRIGGGCARHPRHDDCGLVVARGDGATRLAFVSTDWWIPEVAEHPEVRKLFVRGGDIGGAYRRAMEYRWGRLVVGDKERKRAGGWGPPPKAP